MTRMPRATRRQLLVGLATIWPAGVAFAGSAATAEETGDEFVCASRVIAGSDDLSPGVADRVRGLLEDRVDGFDAALDGLVATMRDGGGDRSAMLSRLDEAQVAFALRIAKPWYLGYVGTPSDFVLDDDAAFATFLEAQAWEKIADVVPRITYPGNGPGWWDAAPPGVAPPAMADGIRGWTFRPDGPPAILAPDPAWLAFATADHADLDAAWAARPAGDAAPSDR